MRLPFLSTLSSLVVVALGLLVTAPTEATCSQPLLEMAPLGDPPHSARVRPIQDADCPPIYRVTATLLSEDAELATRTYHAAAIANPPLLFPVRDELDPSRAAGVYRVDWLVEYETGDTHSLRQPFVVPCPPPTPVPVNWNDADSELSFRPKAVDVCEGQGRAEVVLRDVAGEVVIDDLVAEYVPDGDLVTFEIPPLEGERRYLGQLVLTNRSQRSTAVPFEILTGCGPIVPEAMLIDGVLLGSLAASECQFPVRMEVRVLRSTGDVLRSFESTLDQPSFELQIPDFGAWPAGDFEVRADFHGAVSRARRSFPVSVACREPEVGAVALSPGETANLANLEFSLESRSACQGETRLSVQVRRADRTVVFNRSMDLAAGEGTTRFSWPFPAVPGASYDVAVEAEFGIGFEQSVSRAERAPLQCASPEVLDLGYADADGESLGALIAIAQCNAPAVAKLLVRNASGRIVAEADPRILHRSGESHGVIEPTSVSHLEDGTYSVELTVVDTRGTTASRTVSIEHTASVPTVGFRHDGVVLSPGDFPTLASLEALELVFSGPTPPLSAFSRLEHRLTRAGDGAFAQFTQVDGEMTPQVWFGGYFEHPRSDRRSDPLGVLVRNATGERWLAPIVRTHVPSIESSLDGFHASKSRLGFRSVARIETLAPGSYVVEGVVLDLEGRLELIPGAATFRVSAAATRQHESLLRRGVAEIPVAVTWGLDNVASLERVASVPDGDYALSVVARDMFGNPSEVHALTFRLDQDKASARLEWPAIAGYRRAVQHRFHGQGVTNPGPVRVLLRRVSGTGEIRVNRQRVTDQSVELLLTPDPSGAFTLAVELSDADVDGRFVIHPDDTRARPLELSIQTYRPQFLVQRLTGEDSHVLSIRNEAQSCRHVIFDELARVSLRSDEVVCAVRLNIPGTSVSSVSPERTEVRLPPDASPSWMYEEGFIRVASGEPVFHQTRQVPIADLQAFSSTPQLEFVALPRWRDRSMPGVHLTETNRALAGHVLIRAGLEEPLVFIDDEPVDIGAPGSRDVRIPVFTDIDALGDTQTVRLRAYYPSAPTIEASETYHFLAVPEEPVLRATGGQFVHPDPLLVTLSLGVSGGRFSPDDHGRYEVLELSLIRRDRPDADPIAVPPASIGEDGSLSVGLPSVSPGRYRLLTRLVNVDPRFEAAFRPLSSEADFEVLDGTPVEASLFSFIEADKAPFFGQLAIELEHAQRRSDIARVSWEVSVDGRDFAPHYCCGSSLDFALPEPTAIYYRAELTNRHSGAVSHTRPLQLRAFLGGELRVLGPRHTFRGYPARYSVEGLPRGQDVLWRVLTPNATAPQEYRGATLEIAPEETGRYFVEVVADTGTLSPDDPSAFRTYFTLNSSWPRLPPPVISGPSEVEFGRVASFTVIQPEMFPDRGNPDIVRVGEWELPDGSRVPGEDWLEFTLRELPEDEDAVVIVYHTWIDGDRTTLASTSHVVRPVRYEWPDWQLQANTTSLQPPSIVRLSVTPPEWRDWMGLGSYSVTTHWDLPSHVRVVHRTPTSAIVFAPDNRPFSVAARITDPRGNVTEVRRADVRPAHQVPFDVALRLVPERSLITAPINVTAHVDPIVVPQDSAINRVAYYLNGLYVGVTDGSSMNIRLTTPGEHEIRAIASADGAYTTSASTTVSVGHNIRATCTITAVGDFRLNGLARADCNDPDGHMVGYRWYADGQLLSDSGARVTLGRAQRLSVSEISLIAVDNGGLETTARFVVPPRETQP